MGSIWHDNLYTPLLNFLMFLYSGPAAGNFGVAIIELTVILRVLLLPLSVVEEKNRARYERLNERIDVIEHDFKTDHVMRKDKIRELLKEHKVSYWSKVVLLAIQALVLVLLYQVFLGGIRFTHAETLYSWVNAPSMVNTLFLGFDLAERSLMWAGAVGVLLFLQIYTVQKRREHLVNRSDIMYMFLFPIFTVIVLLLLPMMKSIFILTSMLFSMLVFVIRRMIWGSGAPKKA
jgi:membrane protein insertase Oxa1/YidC/SpoIIIJ